MVAFTVVQAGPHVCVQDGGRAGLMRFGAPASGPMDRIGFAAANAALGNPVGGAGIEVSLGGLTLDCTEGSISFAVAGGGFSVSVDGRPLAPWVVAGLREGARLAIRPGRWGSWAFLAFAGQLRCRQWLGSAATHAPSGQGGGRLVAGDRLLIDAAEVRERRHRALAVPVSARPRAEVRVVSGPQDRFFSPSAKEAFMTSAFMLTDAYDRMGVRLAGPSLRPEAALDMPSEAILRGSVQVAGDGVATVLLADHQTTGGYPKIATVLDADLDRFVQLRSRDRVVFRAVDPQAAVDAFRTRRLSLQRYLAGLTEGL